MLLTIALGERERKLFRAAIDHYVASGKPMNSRILSKLEECLWSPAAIRNITAILQTLLFHLKKEENYG